METQDCVGVQIKEMTEEKQEVHKRPSKYSLIHKKNKLGIIVKTYGEKPIIFAFEENGEQYMIGSEVGNYLRLFRGALYKKYPGLAKRNLTNDERKKLCDMGHYKHVTSSTISLLLANQVEDILNGRDDQFRPVRDNQPNTGAATTPASRLKPDKPASIISAMPNSSHLDAVPKATRKMKTLK